MQKLLSNKSLFFICLFMALSAVSVGFYKFYITQNYDFIVETSCDPDTEKCSYRNCDIEECPPNGFSYFNTYRIPASEFKNCDENEDCTEFCRNSSICIAIQ